jgi:putative membrane protein
MPSVAQAVLASWSFPTWITALNLLGELLYLRGWLVIRRSLSSRFTFARLISFAGGIALLQIALASPIDAFDPFLLFDHMLQHMLLMMIVPPLLLLGDPIMPLLHGLPRWLTRFVLGPILRWRPMMALGRAVTRPAFALVLISLAMIVWHLSGPYELALRSPGWHEVEHATFLTTALIFWWPVVTPWPGRPRGNSWMLPIYLLLADFVNSAVSAFLTFSDRVYYPSYLVMPRLGGISAQNDQVAAGAMMWVIGSFAFLIPAAAITVRLLSPPGPRMERAPFGAAPEPGGASRTLLALAMVLPLAAVAYGLLAPDKVDIDGDVVRAKELSGTFQISVFTAPEPVPTGDFAVAVLIQDKSNGSPILDGDVVVSAEPLGGSENRSGPVLATRDQAQNKLLEAAALDLPESGAWEVHVSVRRGDQEGSVTCRLQVAPSIVGPRGASNPSVQ